MGAGTIYTVVSSDTQATPSQLRQSTASPPGPASVGPLPTSEVHRYLQLPHPYPRVAALARQITAGVTDPASSDPASSDPRTYDKVEAIEQWMSTHVRYTTDIPPLSAGADAVTSFLFGTRRGYCEQISTATVVMLRSLGIPARETVGYVPGSYDPLTDLFEVHADDAHAWVQVWFPGYGWQNFDPTADVPLADPSPGSVIAHSLLRFLGRLPWIPIGLTLAAASTVTVVVRRRRRRPPTWAHRVAADLSEGGRRRHASRRTDETLTAYGARLGGLDFGSAAGLEEVCRLVERYSYAGVEPSAADIARALAFSRRFAHRPRPRPGPGPGPGRKHRRPSGRSPTTAGQAREMASASSKDAPAASNGR